MPDELLEWTHHNRDLVYPLMRRYRALGKDFLMRSDLIDELERYAAELTDPEHLLGSPLAQALTRTQEAALQGESVRFALRPRIGRWRYYEYEGDSGEMSEISARHYLKFKERIAAPDQSRNAWDLEIDLAPFDREFPRMREARSIGKGVEFLNRRLSSRLFETLEETGAQRLLDFLRMHNHKGRQLLLNGHLESTEELRRAIRRADAALARKSADTPWHQVEPELRALGFEVGWGDTVARIRETLALLSELMEAPAAETFEEFLARIPMIFGVVILSPHGWFGQANVLGRPDTGGQIVYILDQVRALEREMRQRIQRQGLDVEPKILVVTRLIPDAQGTTCDQPRERIVGTEHVEIVRVPFRTPGGEIVPEWISRFEVWPYLERFALDVEREIHAELEGRPDLLIGNYSDGNLVATLLSERLGVTQCNIAHALEKSKYLLSDLYWRQNDATHHFGCQFTADVISMNTADFIITSTYQEIAGTDDTVGQYESHASFSMPGLYRVLNGIDVFDPKFNIVSPGADTETFFPFTEHERRVEALQKELRGILFDADPPRPVRGTFADPEKPIIFVMARMDRIKNHTGIVEWFGATPELREHANLFLIGGHIDPRKSSDREEGRQIERMHALFDQYDLEQQVRWVGSHVDKRLGAEFYRLAADQRGIFVQPALFEAFGLTVIEAMLSGLPTFATRYGGPLEIIEDGVSGFHIDPNHGAESGRKMAEFFQRCAAEPDYWDRISAGGIERVRSRYTWELYAEKLMTLSRVYGFWRFVTDLAREENRRYLEMFYTLQYRPLAEALESEAATVKRGAPGGRVS